MASEFLHRPGRAAPWWRGLSSREAAIVACGALAAAAAVALLAVPARWYFGGAGPSAARHLEVISVLSELSALDARWEREALRMLNDPAPSPAAGSAGPLAAVPKQLERAARELESPILQRSLADVTRAFTEKAGLVSRFEQAHVASRKALHDALAMEAEVAGLLREAWRDAPDRQRLVAADNVVTQLFTDMQRYYFAPAESNRKNLAASIADFRAAAEVLPAGLKAAAARLDHHIADLVRARPQEQAAYDRVRFHHAGPRAATLARELLLELERSELQRARHGILLAVYLGALLVLAAYLAARLIRRELALRKASTMVTEALPVEPTLPPPADPTSGP